MKELTASITINGPLLQIASVLAALSASTSLTATVTTGQSADPLQSPIGTTPLGTVCLPTASAAPTPAPIPTASEDNDDAPNLAAPEFDSAGLPWDARIHSSSKNVKADKTWVKKRGADPQLVAQVEFELRSAIAPVPTPMPVMLPEPAPLPVMPTMPVAVAEPVPLPVAVAAPVPMASPVVDVSNVADFATFMQHLSPKIQAKLVTADDLQEVVVNLNTMFNLELKAITDLMANPAMISTAVQLLAQAGKW